MEEAATPQLPPEAREADVQQLLAALDAAHVRMQAIQADIERLRQLAQDRDHRIGAMLADIEARLSRC